LTLQLFGDVNVVKLNALNAIVNASFEGKNAQLIVNAKDVRIEKYLK